MFQKYYPNSAKINMAKVSMKSILSWELRLFRCVQENTNLVLLSDMHVKERLIWFIILLVLLAMGVVTAIFAIRGLKFFLD